MISSSQEQKDTRTKDSIRGSPKRLSYTKGSNPQYAVQRVWRGDLNQSTIRAVVTSKKDESIRLGEEHLRWFLYNDHLLRKTRHIKTTNQIKVFRLRIIQSNNKYDV